MDDQDILERIERLVDEEHRLMHAHEAEGLSTDEHQRMRDLEVRLDQLWDLLRRRRAAKLQGVAPDQVEPHSIEEVEHYLQ